MMVTMKELWMAQQLEHDSVCCWVHQWVSMMALGSRMAEHSQLVVNWELG